MTEQSKKIGKFLLLFFYVFVTISTLVEQIDFTNEYFTALILSFLGGILTLVWGFNLGLFYSLISFPLAFEFFYTEILTPHLPTFLIHLHLNAIVFGGLYIVLLFILYVKRWNYFAFLIFLLGVFHEEKFLPAQLVSAFSYRELGNRESTNIRKAISRIDENENRPIYLICLDGYPNLSNTKYVKLSVGDSLLKVAGFQQESYLAKGFQTPISVRYLFTGKYWPQEFTNLNAHGLKNELHQCLREIAPQGYQIYLGSILVDYNLAKPFFPAFSSIRPNKWILMPLEPYFSKESHIGTSEAMELFHKNLISQIDGQTNHIKFLHFLTFHGYSTKRREFLTDLKLADKLLIRILSQIKNQAPNSKVIIFSDHGERFTKGFDPRAGIFYVNY